MDIFPLLAIKTVHWESTRRSFSNLTTITTPRYYCLAASWRSKKILILSRTIRCTSPHLPEPPKTKIEGLYRGKTLQFSNRKNNNPKLRSNHRHTKMRILITGVNIEEITRRRSKQKLSRIVLNRRSLLDSFRQLLHQAGQQPCTSSSSWEVTTRNLKIFGLTMRAVFGALKTQTEKCKTKIDLKVLQGRNKQIRFKSTRKIYISK